MDNAIVLIVDETILVVQCQLKIVVILEYQTELYVNGSYDLGQFKVYIHNQSLAPSTLYNKGYFISSGIYNYFQLDRVYEQKLEEPYNSCLKDPNLFQNNKTLINYISANNKAYSQKYCFSLCRSMKYMENNECNCTLDSFEEDAYLKCFDWNSDKKERPKKDECLKNYNLKYQRSLHTLCSDYCPLECDSFEYVINYFSQSIPRSGKINDEFYEFETYENVSKSFLSLYVYFEDEKYTLISQYPKTQLFDLLSNIGGIFGLFLGMGLLSFVEIFEIFLECFFVMFE